MKRFLALFLVLVMVCALAVSCGNTDETPDTGNTPGGNENPDNGNNENPNDNNNNSNDETPDDGEEDKEPQPIVLTGADAIAKIEELEALTKAVLEEKKFSGVYTSTETSDGESNVSEIKARFDGENWYTEQTMLGVCTKTYVVDGVGYLIYGADTEDEMKMILDPTEGELESSFSLFIGDSEEEAPISDGEMFENITVTIQPNGDTVIALSGITEAGLAAMRQMVEEMYTDMEMGLSLTTFGLDNLSETITIKDGKLVKTESSMDMEIGVSMGGMSMTVSTTQSTVMTFDYEDYAVTAPSDLSDFEDMRGGFDEGGF